MAHNTRNVTATVTNKWDATGDMPAVILECIDGSTTANVIVLRTMGSMTLRRLPPSTHAKTPRSSHAEDGDEEEEMATKRFDCGPGLRRASAGLWWPFTETRLIGGNLYFTREKSPWRARWSQGASKWAGAIQLRNPQSPESELQGPTYVCTLILHTTGVVCRRRRHEQQLSPHTVRS